MKILRGGEWSIERDESLVNPKTGKRGKAIAALTSGKAANSIASGGATAETAPGGRRLHSRSKASSTAIDHREEAAAAT